MDEPGRLRFRGSASVSSFNPRLFFHVLMQILSRSVVSATQRRTARATVSGEAACRACPNNTHSLLIIIIRAVADEDQMGEDFVGGVCCQLQQNTNLIPQLGFLSNLVKVFPSLATRPLLVTGESYAGTYIVSFLYKYFSRIVIPFAALHFENVLWHRKPSRQHHQGCHW